MIVLRVAPRAARSAIVGPHGGALRVRIAAVPADGAANRELVSLLAGVLGVRPNDVAVERGLHGRDKQVLVRGLLPEQVLARIR